MTRLGRDRFKVDNVTVAPIGVIDCALAPIAFEAQHLKVCRVQPALSRVTQVEWDLPFFLDQSMARAKSRRAWLVGHKGAYRVLAAHLPRSEFHTAPHLPGCEWLDHFVTVGRAKHGQQSGTVH